MNIIDVILNNKHIDVKSLDYSGQNAVYYANCNQHGMTTDIVKRFKVPLRRAKSKFRARRSSANPLYSCNPLLVYHPLYLPIYDFRFSFSSFSVHIFKIKYF